MEAKLPQSKETQWFPPDEMLDQILSGAEIQEVVEKSNADQSHAEFLDSKLPVIVVMQARIRAKKIRNKYVERKQFLAAHEAEVKTIQRTIRGIFARRRFLNRLKHFHDHLQQIVLVCIAITAITPNNTTHSSKLMCAGISSTGDTTHD